MGATTGWVSAALVGFTRQRLRGLLRWDPLLPVGIGLLGGYYLLRAAAFHHALPARISSMRSFIAMTQVAEVLGAVAIAIAAIAHRPRSRSGGDERSDA